MRIAAIFVLIVLIVGCSAFSGANTLADENARIIEKARVILSSTRLRSEQLPQVVSVQKLSFEQARRELPASVSENSDRASNSIVWLVIFEGKWQALPPDPSHTITPVSPAEGCVFVLMDANEIGLQAGGPSSCTAASTTLPAAVPSDTPSATPATAPSPRPIADYPLALQNTWVYQSTRYEGFNTGQVMTATSTITETVVEINPAPDNYAAKIRRETTAETPIAGPPDLQKQLARPAESSEYWLVVAHNRIYRQEGKPDLAKLTDQDALEFQFPLNVGTRWVWFPAKLPNAPDPVGGVFRQVLKIGPIQVPAGRFNECFLIQDGWTTDTSTNWFCPGIGWVERKSDHNGTPYGSHWRLLRYQLSPQ